MLTSNVSSKSFETGNGYGVALLLVKLRFRSILWLNLQKKYKQFECFKEIIEIENDIA